MLKSIFSFLLWVLTLLLLVAAVLKLFFVDVIVLGHDAMAPTLTINEQAFVWRNAEPEFGDIVVCGHPKHPGELVVGRVLGREGHKLKSERGALSISGEKLQPDFRDEVRFRVSMSGREHELRRATEAVAGSTHEALYAADRDFELRETEVEPGRLFLLGDNRAYSGHDSRSYGTVDADTCQGVVFMRFRTTPEGESKFGHGFLDLL